VTALARVKSIDDLFAPVDEDSLVGLFAEHSDDLEVLERTAEFMSTSGISRVLAHFVDGNKVGDSRYGSDNAVRNMFKLEGARASLDASYWQRALDLTDVHETMPQKRRDEWYEQIKNFTTPRFEPATVVSTLQGLLASRLQFFAEKVDGCFTALSGEHVTNRPEGFGKRMIYSGLYYDYSDARSLGYLFDLRSALAKIRGRSPPSYNVVSSSLRYAREHCRGEWVEMDGGACRIRCYKKGTAHVEVHPDLAWRLNQVLAFLHPRAIPPEHRERPRKATKQRALFDHMIPSPVVAVLDQLTVDAGSKYSQVRYRFGEYEKVDKAVRREVAAVLHSLGATSSERTFNFDYNAGHVLNEVIASACVPDHRSYQYYPTPKIVAQFVIEQAQIGAKHLCLEPSAGQGHIAKLLPVERTTCVEVSALHCKVLRAKDYFAVEADFLKWAIEARHGQLFDRVVMNPPFAEGQARAHVEAAATLVCEGGRLVAVLPASMACKIQLASYNVTWSPPFENEFAGTGVSVVVMTAVRRKT
jgi:hypothetical protein